MKPGHDVRLLSRSGVPAYTRTTSLSMVGEPEAVSEDEQDWISEKARRLHDDTLQGEWRKASGRIHTALGHFEKTSKPPRDLERQLRGIQRATSAVDKRFDA